MRRFISSVILSIFFIWILPLGIFIKPSQEKLACDGQRAICLCSHLLKKAAPKAVPANSLTASASAEQKESNAGSSSYQFLAGDIAHDPTVLCFGLFSQYSSQYSFRLLKPIKHVPKA